MRPITFAHRGGRAHGAENTIPLFRRALEHGAAGIESDARLSADGEVVLVHDPVAKRGWRRRRVDQSTAAELAQATRALEQARAKLREAAAQVEAARVQLGYASITAPIGGVVGSVSTQEGETVAASFAAPTFLTIVDLARLEVQAYVDETDIGRVAAGQQATFRVDTWPDDVFEGRVTAVRPTAEVRDNVVNYVTLIEFRNRPERLLRPEMTATVTLTVEGRPGVLSVPNGALRRDAAGTYVMVARGTVFERRGVAPGFRGSV